MPVRLIPHDFARQVLSTAKPNNCLAIFISPVLTNKFGLLVKGDVEFGSKTFALLGRPFATATKTTRVFLALPNLTRASTFDVSSV
jgi:hypothetical protein